MTYAYLVLGSGASACTWEFVSLKDTMQSVEHLEREAGRVRWLRPGERRRLCFLVCVFPLESVWEGPFPEAGGYGEEGELGTWSCPVTLLSSSPGGQK